jgi:sporulation protein YlmC with PRC-barrel domain
VTQGTATLVRLDDTDLELADPADDVRGKTLVDRVGHEIGEIDGLLIDREERRVRLLQVGSGGFLGIGKQKVLVPVDAVTDVDDTVHIDRNRENIAGGPVYDPEIVPGRTDLADLYRYHGFVPYWTTGYLPPRFPHM